eukprot:19751-Heterococcus_DN1.PRE.2
MGMTISMRHYAIRPLMLNTSLLLVYTATYTHSTWPTTCLSKNYTLVNPLDDMQLLLLPLHRLHTTHAAVAAAQWAGRADTDMACAQLTQHCEYYNIVTALMCNTCTAMLVHCTASNT